jgi:hypothetical protein
MITRSAIGVGLRMGMLKETEMAENDEEEEDEDARILDPP